MDCPASGRRSRKHSEGRGDPTDPAGQGAGRGRGAASERVIGRAGGSRGARYRQPHGFGAPDRGERASTARASRAQKLPTREGETVRESGAAESHLTEAVRRRMRNLGAREPARGSIRPGGHAYHGARPGTEPLGSPLSRFRGEPTIIPHSRHIFAPPGAPVLPMVTFGWLEAPFRQPVMLSCETVIRESATAQTRAPVKWA